MKIRTLLLICFTAGSLIAQPDIESGARFDAAYRHLRECGLRDYKEFSGIAVWLSHISKSDIDAEKRKIEGLRGWVSTQPEPNRSAYRSVLKKYDANIAEATDEAINHTIKKRQDEYEKYLSATSGRAESIYRTMQSPCHSVTTAPAKKTK